MKAPEPVGIIVSKIAEGDQSALRQLYRDIKPGSIHYASLILRDRDLAEDAFQEAFLEGYQKLYQLQNPQAFPAWFRRILFKQCDRILRKKKPGEAGELINTAPDNRPSVHDLLETSELARTLDRTLNGLEKTDRKIVLLYHRDKLKITTIAEMVQLPAHVVKYRLKLIRTNLRSNPDLIRILDRSSQAPIARAA